MFETFSYPAQWPQEPLSWIANDTEQNAWVAHDVAGNLVGHIDCRIATEHPVTPLWCEATGRSEGGLAVISRLFVDPNHLGEGFGTALLRTATEECHRLDLAPVLSVLADHDQVISFYEKQGWMRIGIADDTWNEAVKPIRVVAMIGPSS